MIRSTTILIALVWVPSFAYADKDNLAKSALQILDKYCHRCHGQDGTLEGGLNYVTDLDKLVNRKKVIAQDPDGSPLFRRITKGTMPPAEEPRPTEAEIAVLRQWILSGAHSPGQSSRPLISHAEEFALAQSDLVKIDRRSRRFIRYISLAAQVNSGLGEDELQTYRAGISKLLNSLSWHPQIRVPEVIGERKWLLRFDLRWFMWDANLWNRLLSEYPYGILDTSAAGRAVRIWTASRVPMIRGDWFLATASRPPLYHDLLLIPTTAGELERQLRVDSVLNIQQERVSRAGFNGSGVSRNNRLLERHDAAHGFYWRTYDFEAVPQNLVERGLLQPDRRSLFSFPLGPANGENSFNHAGGEAIFTLPNGLHGYMIFNAQGVRIDKGPVAIVSDPRRPDRAVEPGVSCMSCHVTGILPKADQIREHLARNPAAFSRIDAEVIRALYPAKEKTLAMMAQDAERYKEALSRAGVKQGKFEPVSTLTLRYEAEVDRESAAAELGLSESALAEGIGKSDTLTRQVGALRVAGGTVARQVLVQAMGDLVKELRMGEIFRAGNTGASLPDSTGEADPLEVFTGTTTSAAVLPDGQQVLLAGIDRNVRLWDFEAARERRRFIGHSASVWAVAANTEGTRAVTGGTDGTARLWDITTGQEIRKLDAHLALVTAVSFTPDGSQILTAGLDESLALWDTATGSEIRRIESPQGIIHSVAISSDGRQALSGGDSVRLWSLATGQILQQFSGHTQTVLSVGLSTDGKLGLTGSEDGTARLWNLQSGKCVATLSKHSGAVRAVALSGDGSWAATSDESGAVRLWKLPEGKELGIFRKHSAPVVQIAFHSEDRRTVSVSMDGIVHTWDLAKFGRTEKTPRVEVLPESASSLGEPRLVATGAGQLGPLSVLPSGEIIAVDYSYEQLLKIEPKTGRRQELVLKAPPIAACVSPDGKTIYAIGRSGQAKSWLWQIEPSSFSLIKSMTLEAPTFDITANNSGLVFVSGAGNGWRDVMAVDTIRGEVRNRWGGIWGDSYLRLNTNDTRLYLSSPAVSPGKIEVMALGAGDPAEFKPVVYGSGELPTGGSFLLSPDGKMLIHSSGAALYQSVNREDDLRPVGRKIVPFLDAVTDGRVLYTVRGEILRRYEYPTLRSLPEVRLPGQAYRLAIDSKKETLFVAIIRTEALRDRPRAKGYGDIVAFTLSSSK